MDSLESAYYAHRAFDADHTRRIRSYYAPFFDEHAPVLELGCGQGEFLDVLRERGVAASGVDLDPGMVARATARGHDATLGGAVEFLEQAGGSSRYGGVFCAHLLEHLQTTDAARLVRGVASVLSAGGVAVFVVPNPACYAVLTHDFWRDPTHVRFYDVPLVEFLCSEAGLVVTESDANPLDHPGPPPGFEADLVVDDTDLYNDEGGADDPSVADLRRRLRQTQVALRDLERAHRALVHGLYEPNEVYVVARRT